MNYRLTEDGEREEALFEHQLKGYERMLLSYSPKFYASPLQGWELANEEASDEMHRMHLKLVGNSEYQFLLYEMCEGGLERGCLEKEKFLIRERLKRESPYE